MPADCAAATFAARSSKNTMASAKRPSRGRWRPYRCRGCGLHDPTWCDEIANSNSSMIRSSLVFRSQWSSFELLSAASRYRPRNCSSSSFAPGSTRRDHVVNCREKVVGRQIDVPVVNESFGPLRRRQPSALELIGVRAPGPALEDDLGRRRPSKVLSELLRAGEFDKHATEIEEE